MPHRPDIRPVRGTDPTLISLSARPKGVNLLSKYELFPLLWFFKLINKTFEGIEYALIYLYYSCPT